jgi:protein tyrosine phosphatase (PTP) superfamily phosphohydrolase (DUF442 family)
LKAIAALFVMALPVGCQQCGPPTSQEKPEANSAVESPGPLHLKGLHNVYRITNNLFSGSSPEGDEGFRSLHGLGLKTVISVDGAKPEVELARKHNLRYVHLPFGYDGIPPQRILELAKAVRDLPGPFYVHCHHGKHRGPAAAAAIHLCMDKNCSVEQALAEMQRAGTDPRYTGLYAVPKMLVRPTPKDLDRVPTEFPEVAKVSHVAQFMVEIDARWENLKLIRAAEWKAPSYHPDLDPPHEALQLVELFREASRLPVVNKRPEEFRNWLVAAEKEAANLERLLRPGEKKQEVHRLTDEAFRKAEALCARCHTNYRDVSQKP